MFNNLGASLRYAQYILGCFCIGNVKCNWRECSWVLNIEAHFPHLYKIRKYPHHNMCVCVCVCEPYLTQNCIWYIWMDPCWHACIGKIPCPLNMKDEKCKNRQVCILTSTLEYHCLLYKTGPARKRSHKYNYLT